MLAQATSGLNLPYWQPLAVALIGMTAAAVTLFVGLRMVKSRRSEGPTSKREEAKKDDPFVHGSATEKRQSLRRRGNPVKVFLTDAEATEEPIEAWVLDRSMGGLCLEAAYKEVPVGTILSVRPANATTIVPWIQLEVKSCRKAGERYELGCQFVKTPSWSVLLLFG